MEDDRWMNLEFLYILDFRSLKLDMRRLIWL